MSLDFSLDEIYSEIDIEIDVDEVVMGPPFTKWAQNDETREKVREIIYDNKDKVLSYTKPRSTQKIILKKNSGIENYSPPTGLLDSEYLAVGAVTIGKEIYQNPIRLDVDSGKERMSLELLVCDALENIALDNALRKVALEIKEKANKNSFNTTRVVPPGSGRINWGIENQEFIFNNINADKIGVELKETNAISPQKSLSFVLGIGKEIIDIENIFSCKGCPRTECPYRRE
ncbi:hypothetical protein [Methanonatronarchaeum sp. AMET-Sl]|uniref:hypothetical protein n=1 Tax=Methanonatronarchaeum sp. AMET-Sl TaxID=3037654 RepID=UPI00244E58AD|nr:hypothetical protein [Methanonatronarchaeum sp. AMET-Sl]WGI17053.1 hypothetical protein QEN48_06020 [Methanonatronarchaeum sp. AMET-Sl]